jgi:hypothetical protein
VEERMALHQLQGLGSIGSTRGSTEWALGVSLLPDQLMGILRITMSVLNMTQN